MSNDTPTSTDDVNGLAQGAATERLTETGTGDISLSFYISHPSTAIDKDAVPFSSLVNMQQREELMAYLATLQISS